MEAPFTLSLADFWSWMTAHPNCIIRGGTPDAFLYDDEDLHWHFTQEESTLLVQVLRGKRMLGELFVEPERVAYVQAVPSESQEEYSFEFIAEIETGPVPVYFFVLAHAYESQEDLEGHRVH